MSESRLSGLASQEAQNEQTLQRVANKEGRAAAHLADLSGARNSEQLQQLAQQEAQNQQALEQLARKEEQASSQLSATANATGRISR